MDIFVLDHHPLMCEMMTMLIHRIDPQAHVAVAHTFRQLNSLIDKCEEVDAVIMEPQSIGHIGATSVALAAQRLTKAQIIVITDAELHLIEKPYLQNGAHHIISKKDNVDRILARLHEILQPPADEEQSASEPGRILKISKRHRQLMHLLALGCTNQQMAERLKLSEQTIKVHLYRLYKKLGVKSRLQALYFARTNGWLLDAPIF